MDVSELSLAEMIRLLPDDELLGVCEQMEHGLLAMTAACALRWLSSGGRKALKVETAEGGPMNEPLRTVTP